MTVPGNYNLRNIWNNYLRYKRYTNDAVLREVS